MKYGALIIGVVVAVGCKHPVTGGHDLAGHLDMAAVGPDLARTYDLGHTVDLTPPPDLAFKPPGKCFAKAGAASCKRDSDCGSFASCQEGICCSGNLDPNDCSCHCAGGAECTGGQLCCPGRCWFAPDLGVTRCRPQNECFNCGPA